MALGLGLSRPRLGRQGRLTLFGAYAAHRPDRRHARRRLQLQLNHHLGLCSRPRLGPSRPRLRRHRPPCTVRRVSARCPDRRDAIALLGTRAAHHPDRRDARRRLQLQVSHHLGRCSRLGGTGRLALLGARAARCPDRRGARRACSFSSLILSAAVPALGLGGTGRLTLLGARAGRCLGRHDARRRLQVQPAHHLRHCSRPLLGRHRPPRAARRACCSLP
jgi:hypothetical protein